MNFDIENIEDAIANAQRMAKNLGLDSDKNDAAYRNFIGSILTTVVSAAYAAGFEEGVNHGEARMVLDIQGRESNLRKQGDRLYNEGHIAGRTHAHDHIAAMLAAGSFRGRGIVQQILDRVSESKKVIGGPDDTVTYPPGQGQNGGNTPAQKPKKKE